MKKAKAITLLGHGGKIRNIDWDKSCFICLDGEYIIDEGRRKYNINSSDRGNEWEIYIESKPIELPEEWKQINLMGDDSTELLKVKQNKIIEYLKNLEKN